MKKKGNNLVTKLMGNVLSVSKKPGALTGLLMLGPAAVAGATGVQEVMDEPETNSEVHSSIEGREVIGEFSYQNKENQNFDYTIVKEGDQFLITEEGRNDVRFQREWFYDVDNDGDITPVEIDFAKKGSNIIMDPAFRQIADAYIKNYQLSQEQQISASDDLSDSNNQQIVYPENYSAEYIDSLLKESTEKQDVYSENYSAEYVDNLLRRPNTYPENYSAEYIDGLLKESTENQNPVERKEAMLGTNQMGSSSDDVAVEAAETPSIKRRQLPQPGRAIIFGGRAIFSRDGENPMFGAEFGYRLDNGLQFVAAYSVAGDKVLANINEPLTERTIYKGNRALENQSLATIGVSYLARPENSNIGVSMGIYGGKESHDIKWEEQIVQLDDNGNEDYVRRSLSGSDSQESYVLGFEIGPTFKIGNLELALIGGGHANLNDGSARSSVTLRSSYALGRNQNQPAQRYNGRR